MKRSDEITEELPAPRQPKASSMSSGLDSADFAFLVLVITLVGMILYGYWTATPLK